MGQLHTTTSCSLRDVLLALRNNPVGELGTSKGSQVKPINLCVVEQKSGQLPPAQWKQSINISLLFPFEMCNSAKKSIFVWINTGQAVLIPASLGSASAACYCNLPRAYQGSANWSRCLQEGPFGCILPTWLQRLQSATARFIQIQDLKFDCHWEISSHSSSVCLNDF